MPREEYNSPVGFAREPAMRRRHWLGRIVLALFVAGLAFLLVNGVFRPPDDNPSVPVVETGPLPGPR